MPVPPQCPHSLSMRFLDGHCRIAHIITRTDSHAQAPSSTPSPCSSAARAVKSSQEGIRKIEREMLRSTNVRHNLTYGEVLPHSVEQKLVPMLGATSSSDVFYDLGSGTCKIPLQVAL